MHKNTGDFLCFYQQRTIAWASIAIPRSTQKDRSVGDYIEVMLKTGLAYAAQGNSA